MNILFIHSNYPAQFHWLAAELGSQGRHDVRFLTARRDAESMGIKGIGVELFNEPNDEERYSSPLHAATSNAISRANIIQQALIGLIKNGFKPKLVIAHGSNGLILLIKTVLPECKVIGYFEWYFSPRDAGSLLGSKGLVQQGQAKLRNLVTLQEVIECDTAVTPTQWQMSQFPIQIQDKLNVVFDGVDERIYYTPVSKDRNWKLELRGESAEVNVEEGELLLTYATRGMEPLRGFPEFMRALPYAIKDHRNIKVVIGGRDRSAYGLSAPSHGGSWKDLLLEELGEFEGIERVTFCGLLNRADYARLLQRTNLYCYFSRPYVTSWSLFEAVACGCRVLTNPGGTTTETIPGYGFETCELTSRPDELGLQISRIVGDSKSSANIRQPPQWIFRKETCLQWQNLINETLSGEQYDGQQSGPH